MQTSFFSRRFAAATALVFVVLGVASGAHARSDVTFSIGIQVPGVYAQPAPFYTEPPRFYYQPQTVYVQPAPVYVPPPRVYYQPQTVYVQPAPVYAPPPRIYYQPQTIYLQPRPVFVQPPAYGVYYRSGPDWHRTQWERARKHGHRDQGGRQGWRHGGHHD